MPLTRAELAEDPAEQFAAWYAEAGRSAGLVDPTAAALATADAGGRPTARIVLIKGWDARGFAFYTNYESRKGRELAANPRGALLFWWERLGWQVRVEGLVERLGPEESDAYFSTRPRESQLGAHASPQSAPMASRAELESRFAAAVERFAGREVPRPENWGGYRLLPERYEFWSHGEGRLHDRFEYTRDAAGRWRLERLAP
jgi:pyridoxamine 5'-phosphate oxidase